MEEWDPRTSDLTAIKTKFELRYALPIKPELYDRLEELEAEMFREGNELVVNLPVLTISFDNAWLDDSYLDKRMYIVAPYLDEEEKKQLKEYIIDATKGPNRIEETAEQTITLGEEELKRLEEGLKEIEEEPAKPTKRRRRKKKTG